MVQHEKEMPTSSDILDHLCCFIGSVKMACLIPTLDINHSLFKVCIGIYDIHIMTVIVYYYQVL